jgi:YidC/Oxa1 family membrane protein insertase
MIGLILFSILQPLEDAVRWVLERFHYNLGVTWAWAIVGTTIVVRILLVPLTVRQIHSMQSMQRHAPEMKEIQRKYKGDRQKLNEELMKFYRENHINPAASCLPLVAQFPVFISLYLVLRNFSSHVPAGSDLSWLYIVPDITAKATRSGRATCCS